MSHSNYEDFRHLLGKLAQIEERIEESKALYEARDQVTLELKELGFTAVEHEGIEYRLTDNFAEKNVAYRVAFVRRWEITVKRPKKEKK